MSLTTSDVVDHDHARSGISRRRLVSGALGVAGALAMTTAVARPSQAASPLGGAGLRTVVGLGSRAAHVHPLQQSLSQKGYWLGEPDGYYGHLTQQAVYALQKANGLTPDGQFGRNSFFALAGELPAPRTPAPDLPGNRIPRGVRIEIDLGAQLLKVIEGGRTRWVFNTSTGNGQPYDWYGQTLSAVTPPGSFSVFNTYSPGWQPGPLGDLYRPQYFNGGIAVHGSEYIPPWADSHGCARVSVAAMDMFWETGTMTMDTPVTVV